MLDQLLDLNREKPERLLDNPVIDRQWPLSMTAAQITQVGFGLTGDQRIYRFPNGFGASLVQICRVSTDKDEGIPYTGVHPITDEFLWEVGIVQFNSADDLDFTLTSETPIASEVIRYVTDSRAESILQKIKDLPSV